MSTKPPVAVAIAAGLFTAAAAAHNFWITPAAFHTEAVQPIDLTLLVGHGGNAEPYDRSPDHLKRFCSVAPDGTEHDVPAAPRSTQEPSATPEATTHHPAGRVTPTAPGVHIVGYRSHPSEIELDAKKFTGYLKEEGLEHIIADRAKRNETDRPGRESYSRACKTLILSGEYQPGTPTEGFDRQIGLTVEITPLTDPFTLQPGDEFRVSVHNEGNPATNIQIDAEQWSSADDLIHIKAQTDEQGHATFKLTRPGTWLITTTIMQRAAPRADVEWQSVWASLTINVQD